MSAETVYAQALAKQQWADKHIQDLEAALAVFSKSNPSAIGVKQDAETGDITYYILNVPTVPPIISLIVGDVLHSLRGALDYVACGMVVAGGGEITSKTKFPILKVATDWEVSGLRMVNGSHEDAFKELRRIAPYEGGNHLLWVLHMMNIVDKHRLLLSAVLVNSGRTLGPNEESFEPECGKPGFTANFAGRQINLKPLAGPPVPLYAGYELLTVPTSQANENLGFFMDVAINEPGLAEGTPILFLLRLLSAEVRDVIDSLSPFLG